MILSGCIDAAVNGGTKKYMDAFLTPQFLENNSGEVSAFQFSHRCTQLASSLFFNQNNAKWQRELKDELSQQILSLQVPAFGSATGCIIFVPNFFPT